MGQSDEERELNLDILRMNKDILKQNEDAIQNNRKMAEEEHRRKLELFDLQKYQLQKDIYEKETTQPNTIDMVRQFHEYFGHPVESSPKLIDEDRAKLRLDLLKEELGEICQAVEDGDLTEIADGLVDLQYILSGTVIEYGMKDIFRSLFEEVHRSNMSKGCKTQSEAEATVDKYHIQGVDCYYKKVSDSFYVVLRTDDDKILKSTKYSPVDFSKILK